MRIVLAAQHAALADAFDKYCGDLACVEVYRGSILDTGVDAVVSPANSYGFMDGGIDAIYTKHFGEHVQQRLQDVIKSEHHGELLVGSAAIVPTDAAIPFVIAAPTMRVPMILDDTVNPYLAARAVFLLINHGRLDGWPIYEHVQSVAFPGLGTGVGRVPPEVCAHQMRKAIENFALDNYEFPATWFSAQTEHQRLYTNDTRDLQF